ncbi:hypothetical protein ASD00_36115 [Ensifer sp. Root31]|uniref:hypothetical protein n=1 Tax=Ensifer sp. Root31 TaxID=1736512 RepID=UPI00070FC69B|nr:hypothetical protein [Ensifer sp. Root31]KQU79835.1 hypothetical protein ASD00_36115 [Ensifer sp. Root31]
MGASFTISPLKPAERAFLRRLSEMDGQYLLASGLREKLAGCALAQIGYARRHSIYPHHFAIAAAGEYYLDRLMRAH